MEIVNVVELYDGLDVVGEVGRYEFKAIKVGRTSVLRADLNPQETWLSIEKVERVGRELQVSRGTEAMEMLFSVPGHLTIDEIAAMSAVDLLVYLSKAGSLTTRQGESVLL
ncbi:hypothetical protein J2Z32_002125 [Paenibacillus turicensis]|uniref:Uncharacterized protein n=1 Tax=Paenibacillus turicensis TaxID=160487 RepID=A0ABS4FSE6_9BACL|nr:hypothetical protein [Paenibacillus turicensis]MBP1905495.1 hypothetical protein [Paenibacillus turicensis]